MAVLDSPHFDGHEQVVFCHDPASGLKAIIGIHSIALGPATGGCRMWPYAGEQAAVDDVLRLSRGMTYKAAVAGLDLGGGKAVIIGDPQRDKSTDLLLAMAGFVNTLGGRYQTAEDVGTTIADMAVMRRATPFAHGFAMPGGDHCPATAFGVFVGLRAAVRHCLGRDNFVGLTVAVQGVGNVGMRLCRYLSEAGAKLIVADVNAAATGQAAQDFGARIVSPDAIHREPADVFAPCALGGILTDASIADLTAPVVAGAANNQLAEDRHGAVLRDRGILYAPDYVINAGGLIDVACEGPDYDVDRVLAKVARIETTLTTIFDQSTTEHRPTNVIADRLAQSRLRCSRLDGQVPEASPPSTPAFAEY
jgi:leucine dehydrogenase